MTWYTCHVLVDKCQSLSIYSNTCVLLGTKFNIYIASHPNIQWSHPKQRQVGEYLSLSLSGDHIFLLYRWSAADLITIHYTDLGGFVW